MTASRRVLTALVLILTAALAHAQAYTSIVVIGDSLSDTGNDTKVSASTYGPAAAVPAPVTGYTNGSFTDGIDTLPPATLYNGVWIKQLAAMLAAKPPVVDSLDGGTNYAYGFAFTGSGTTNFTYGPGNALSFPVNNMGLQLSTYLATKPTITNKTLFVVWGGANDLLNGINPGAAATNELNVVTSLISAGATDILVCGLPPLGSVPRLAGTGATATQATAAAAGFNQIVSASIANFPVALGVNNLHLYYLDVFTLFNTIIANPSTYGFTNVTDMSQAAAVNPDKYLFWDGLHPTTAGHHQLALAAAALIAPGATSISVTTNSPASNLNAAVTLVATVKSSFGTPTGVVTFYDGTTAIGTAQLTGTATDTATFTTTSLAAGTHSISATYGATQYFIASTSNPVSEVVTAPALIPSITPTALTITSGSSGTATLTVASIGGYTGPVTLSCGSLPDQIACSFSPSTLTFLGANNTLTSTLTVNTGAGLKSSLSPARPNSFSTLQAIAACSLLPFFGLLAFRRKSLRSLPLLALFLLLSSGALLGLSGCGSGSNITNAHTGLYAIPVNLTAGSNASTSISFMLTVN